MGNTVGSRPAASTWFARFKRRWAELREDVLKVLMFVNRPLPEMQEVSAYPGV